MSGSPFEIVQRLSFAGSFPEWFVANHSKLAQLLTEEGFRYSLGSGIFRDIWGVTILQAQVTEYDQKTLREWIAEQRRQLGVL